VAGDLTTPAEVATVVEERGLRGISEGLVREGIEGESLLAILRSASTEDPLAVLVWSTARDPDMDSVTSSGSAVASSSASSVALSPRSEDSPSPILTELADTPPDGDG
jgi:hypothetical protein